MRRQPALAAPVCLCGGLRTTAPPPRSRSPSPGTAPCSPLPWCTLAGAGINIDTADYLCRKTAKMISDFFNGCVEPSRTISIDIAGEPLCRSRPPCPLRSCSSCRPAGPRPQSSCRRSAARRRPGNGKTTRHIDCKRKQRGCHCILPEQGEMKNCGCFVTYTGAKPPSGWHWYCLPGLHLVPCTASCSSTAPNPAARASHFRR